MGVIPLEHELLLNPSSVEIEPAAGEPVVWVFPVYSWGVPPVVVNFIKNCRLRCGVDTLHHVVMSCGDDAGLTCRQWRGLMRSRGWNDRSATTVIMPNTYVLMKGFDTDKPALATEKLLKSRGVIERACERIRSGLGDEEIIKGRFAWIKSHIIYPWFTRHAMSPEPFHALDSCTGCGKCSRDCPMDNITMTADGPRWGSRCALCLRCYHRCRSGAVAYGRATLGKHRYDGPGSCD